MIYVPGCPRPYITNDPRIFLDAKSWEWPCESRPYADAYCKAMLKQEHLRFESDRRAEQLEQYWTAELERRRKSMQATQTVTYEVPMKHAKKDSVLGVIMEVRELSLDDDILA
jgi:hypothetical protein